MKKNHLWVILVLLLGLASCTQNHSSSSSASSSSSGGGSDSTTGGGTSGSGYVGGTPGTGVTCNGTSADGQGAGTPIHHLNLFLAGFQDWLPQVNSNSLAQMTFITPQEASILFSSDSRLRVRFAVKPQPIPPTGQTYCYGRNTGAGIPPYQKLKFDVYLRDIKCSTGSTTTCASGQYILGPRYGGPITIGPVDINGCSPIIDLGHLRNQNNFGTTIEVAAVKSDQTCNSNGDFCPAEKNVRSMDCWHMTMQVVTDTTQDFN
jgi:hypothetical protein